MNKNKTKKELKKILLIITLIVIGMICLQNNIYAAFIQESYAYEVEDCGELLKYNGVPVITSYIECNGQPAYCMDKTKPGAETGSYNLKFENLLQDVGLWRIIVNGYPYKTEAQLGVANKKEAFTATKHAIFCYRHGNNPENYTAVGDQENGPGARTLKAMKAILQAANESTETKPSSRLNIDCNNWEVHGNYIEKTYSVSAGAPMQKYKVTLTKDNSIDIGGIKLTDINNQEKDTFEPGEQFKVRLPMKDLTEDGSVTVKVNSQVETKPVLYGVTQKPGTQDYAVVAGWYEDGEGELTQGYMKNNTKIIVLKKDEDSGNMLEGVEFQLLDENYKPIYTDLKTNSEGKIEIENLNPGIYYLKETKSIDDYDVYPELIKIDLEYQEEMTVTVNNKKEEPKIETIRAAGQIASSQKVENVTKKLPVAGM